MGRGIKWFCANTLAHFRWSGKEVLLDNVELDNANNEVMVSEVRSRLGERLRKRSQLQKVANL